MSKFAVFSGAVILETATTVSDPKLHDAFSRARAEWEATGRIWAYPVIRVVRPTDAIIHRVVARGSTDEQVMTVINALRATKHGEVKLDATSNHVKNWAVGNWKAKSVFGQELVRAVGWAQERGIVITLV